MKVLWIGGWAIASNAMETLVSNTFPEFDHFFIHPHEGYLESIDNYDPDVVIGYSLGATLLLMQNPIMGLKEYLIAPFLNVKNATRIKSTQLKYLLKWLRKDPISAINDFYERSQLCFPKLTEIPYPLHDLIWGIETLIQTEEIIIRCNKEVFLGSQDPIINQRFFLNNDLRSTICVNVDHNLKGYLKFLSFR